MPAPIVVTRSLRKARSTFSQVRTLATQPDETARESQECPETAKAGHSRGVRLMPQT